MSARRPDRRRWRLLTLVPALGLLAGCGAASPISVGEADMATDVTVTATVEITDSAVTYDFEVTNDTAEPIWLVGGRTVIPDVTSRNGVVVILAAFPVRDDVEHLYPPRSGVLEIAPGTTHAERTRVDRPFAGFDDLPGGREVSLPRNPATVRLCVAFIRDSRLSPGTRPTHDDGTGRSDGLWMDRESATSLQEYACTEPEPLR